MLLLNNFEDIQIHIDGKLENDEFDVKRDFISIEKTSQMITSFMNSDTQEQGYIIIGVGETDNKADVNKVKFVTFPADIDSKIRGKQKTKCANLEEYIDKISTYFRNNTIPNIPDLENYLEIRVIDAQRTSVGGQVEQGKILLIKIRRYEKSLIQVTDGRQFYARLPQPGSATDFGSLPMSVSEVQARMLARYYNLPSLGRPLYYDSITAVPDLRILFDFIYLGDFEQAKTLLERIPTLTQMEDSKGRNALDIAVLYGRQDLVDLLLDTYNMSLFHRDKEGRTPLLNAAYVGNLSLVQQFLAINPDLIHDRHRTGYNVFLMASNYGHVHLMEHYLELKESRNYRNASALQVASYAASLKSVQFLLGSQFNWEIGDLTESLKTARSHKESCESSDKSYLLARVSIYEEIIELIQNKLAQCEMSPAVSRSIMSFGSPVFGNNIASESLPPESRRPSEASDTSAGYR